MSIWNAILLGFIQGITEFLPISSSGHLSILNNLFGKEICEPLFGSVNLFASSGGLPLWANLILAVAEEVQNCMSAELAAREQRIAKYTAKYQKESESAR